MHTSLHAAGFLLDPEYIDMAQNANEEIMTGFYGLVEQLIPDVGQQVLIANQLTKFRSKQGIFDRPIAIASVKTLPAYQWWSNFGASVPELQNLAIKILSQTASSSAAERNWSLRGFFHNKKRCRLNSKTVEKMVYIHGNTRLLDNITDVDYDEAVVDWEQSEHLESASGSESSESEAE